MNDETKIPLKWAFALLSCSGGALILAMSAMLWLSNVANTAENAKIDVSKHDQSIDKMDDTLKSIDRRLSNIEGALGVKPPRSGSRD